MQAEQPFKLGSAQEREYERILKRSVYCELFAREMITERQLSELLNRLMKGGSAKYA